MSVIDPRFDQRLRMIALRKQLDSRHGPSRYMSRDGVVGEDRVVLLVRSILRNVGFLVCVGIVLKVGVYLVAPSGGAYQARIDEFATGNWAQRSLAVVLQADPATVAVADFLEGFFR